MSCIRVVDERYVLTSTSSRPVFAVAVRDLCEKAIDEANPGASKPIAVTSTASVEPAATAKAGASTVGPTEADVESPVAAIGSPPPIPEKPKPFNHSFSRGSHKTTIDLDDGGPEALPEMPATWLPGQRRSSKCADLETEMPAFYVQLEYCQLIFRLREQLGDAL